MGSGGRNQFRCILALKSDICWHSYNDFAVNQLTTQ